jgi:pimeloyl-ACP methyl ester carboxylesterase/uncharacterized protein YndB with AHSA1/START domain
MPHEFELRKEIILDATPEQVWEAIATGQGIDAWFMGRNQVEPREGGRTSMTIGDQTEEAVVTAWDPPKRFAYRGESPGVAAVFMAFEWLIEGRDDGTTVLRLVQSGMLGDDWETEYDALAKGWGLYLHQLAQYLRYFRGRTATPIMAMRPGPGDADQAWAAINGGLGLSGAVTEGERVRLAPAGLPPVEGVVDYVSPEAWGVRADDGLYRFIRGFDGTVAVGHHLFADDVDAGEAERAWDSWLGGLFDRTTGYAPVNGLQLYYEVHGSGRPLVLLHGNLSTIGVDFGRVIPSFARTRRVVAVEQQAHGHTADIDRPLTIQHWAEDTIALLGHLGIEQADFFGYSSGSTVALQIAIEHPELVGRLVLASASYRLDGLHPGLMEGISQLRPEHLAGTPFEQDYARVAPNPDDWPKLIAKITEMDKTLPEWTDEDIKAITAPTMLIIGDSDIVRPEHAVEMFRLRGGGVIGDLVGLPSSRLAILPGTTHVTLVQRASWLSSMVQDFLDAPEPAPPGHGAEVS